MYHVAQLVPIRKMKADVRKDGITTEYQKVELFSGGKFFTRFFGSNEKFRICIQD